MSPAFLVVFGVFVLAILALAVTAIRWGMRRDRVANTERAARGGLPAAPGPTAPPGQARRPGNGRP